MSVKRKGALSTSQRSTGRSMMTSGINTRQKRRSMYKAIRLFFMCVKLLDSFAKVQQISEPCDGNRLPFVTTFGQFVTTYGRASVSRLAVWRFIRIFVYGILRFSKKNKTIKINKEK